MSDYTEPHRLPAGVTLKAVESLAEQTSFSRAQVAYLIHLAFLSGAGMRRLFDAGDLAATWEANTPPRVTHEMRVAAEMRIYAERDEIRRAREAERDWPEMDWPEVAAPGGGA